MKIAILGGSFDPPHKGHIAIARYLLKFNNFNQVWLMPCYSHPFVKNLSAPSKRLAMTKYLENDNIKVSDFEIGKKTISYSINALKYLTNKYPKNKFSWVIGEDQVKDFTKWKGWKEIINKFNLIIIPRSNFKTAEKGLENIVKQSVSSKNIILIDREKFSPIHISSTLIRKKIKEKIPISDFVPKKIEKYITERNLYQ